jgi:hypothetical protein
MTNTKISDDTAEVAKKRVEEDRKVTERSRAEFVERTKGKPTPTQEENDLAAVGAHILTHEYDGSDLENPDKARETASKHMEASRDRPQGYQTRQSRSAE